MTGFGHGQFSNDKFSVAVEIKTVNNRFLDVNLRLANELQTIETQIKRLVTARLSRGRIDVYVNTEQTGDVVYELNRPLIAGYLSALRRMQTDFSLAGEPDLNVIARLPNVLQTKKDEVDERFAAAIEQACLDALDELETMRAAEGKSLQNELETRVATIENLLPAIETQSDAVAEEYSQRLTKRIENLLKKSESQIELDSARLAQEVAYLADKSDISEEISRLRSHLEQFRQIINEDGEVGKKLDFLTQELNREVNTIASKTNIMTIKESALAMKAEIEKIREQIQNVE